MSDLVERLRKKKAGIRHEAADRIEALEAALRLAHEWVDPTEMPDADYYTIRAALAQQSRTK